MHVFLERGHRQFTVASLLTIVIAVLHMTGLFNEPYDEDWAAAEDAMRAATVEMGPATMSLYGMFIGSWIQVGALLALLGIKNLAVLWALPTGSSRSIVRTLSIVDGLVYTGLAVLFAVYVIPPPLIAFIVLAILFFAAAFTSRGASE